jgi:Rrf2 family protein
MILSQTAVYAVQAALHLAESDPETPIRVDDIAEELGVPRNYLSKILHTLARGDLLASTRGPHGGFRLARRPSDMMLSEVVAQFDDLPAGSGCLLGRARCSDQDACAAHDRWKSVSSAISDFFCETSLADLLKSPSNPLIRRPQ